MQERILEGNEDNAAMLSVSGLLPWQWGTGTFTSQSGQGAAGVRKARWSIQDQSSLPYFSSSLQKLLLSLPPVRCKKLCMNFETNIFQKNNPLAAEKSSSKCMAYTAKCTACNIAIQASEKNFNLCISVPDPKKSRKYFFKIIQPPENIKGVKKLHPLLPERDYSAGSRKRSALSAWSLSEALLFALRTYTLALPFFFLKNYCSEQFGPQSPKD